MKRTAVGAVVAAALLIGGGLADDQASPSRQLHKGEHVGAPGQIEKLSCEEVRGPHDISGLIFGSLTIDPGGITCLHIETKAGRIRTIQVPRRIYNRCIEGDHYPHCAQE